MTLRGSFLYPLALAALLLAVFGRITSYNVCYTKLLRWICTTWVMFFTARTMVLLQPFPQVMLWVLAAGAGLIVLFMTPPARLKTEWFNHVMFPLT